ncbi:MAG: tetratricopeptide repeat protein [Anaerolineaceae bacterium]|jgi:tetratricopeptide (TPR) repeat protein
MSENIELVKQLAIANYNRKRYDAAITGFEECLAHFESVADELGAAEARNNLSVTHLGMKNPQQAFDEVSKTAEIFARHGDRKREGMAIANTAAALEALGRREEALELYEQVLEIFKELGEKEMRASILRRVSDLQLKTKRGYQAIASMEAAFDQGDKPHIKDSVFRRVLTFLRKKLTG